MNRGKLDKLLIVEEPTVTEDTTGQYVITGWTEFAQVYAEDNFKSGGEANQADQEVAVQKVVFKCNYVAGINETMRVNDQGTYYYIEDVYELRRGHTLQLTTEKKDN